MGIVYSEKPYEDHEILNILHPVIREWFKRKFGSFTPPQKYAVKLIHDGKNVLVFSPTGSGKTLSAFLSIINELYELQLKGELEDRVYCVYISPLRALSNDIKRNLEEPLKEISEVAEGLGYEKPEIRVAVRTGDTTQSERSRMVRKPPHILITTPESLAIVLNAPKFSQHLRNVRWVIVDEVHELSDNKRGVHLSLSLERLQDMVGREFVRIGLSATQAPVEEIAKWLVGFRDSGEPRDCVIVNVYFTKKLDLKVLAPVKNLLGTSFEDATEQMYHLIKKLVDSHRTTLIFTNTRSGTERVAFKLMELYGKEHIDNLGAHHGSLGRKTRLEVEEKLKKGEMKAVVTSSSLELGIDIGYIDLVIQIGSPKSVAKGLQRVGRSGHALNKPSKGRIIVFDRDDLVECAVLVKAAYDGKIDRVQIPKNALDVLAQHIVGMSLTKKWKIEEAFKLVKRSYNFRDLSFEKFMSVLKYLAGFYSDLEERQVYRKIWLDLEEGVFGRKRGSRMIYYLNLGTIPDEADYIVVHEGTGRILGQLSEPFVERLSPGDVFVLGAKTYIFKRARGTKVYVEPAHGRRPTVPSWVGEMLPRSFDLSIEVGKFRELLWELLEKGVNDEEIISLLMKDYRLDKNSAVSILEYFKEQLSVAEIIPTHRRLLIEEWIDKRGRQNIIFHFPFGRRTNDALSKAYAYVISKKVKSNVATSLTDNGFMLTLPEGKHFDIRKIPKLLKSNELRSVLQKAIFNTELFKNRFRHVAARSFMILRNYKGHEISVSRQQLKSQQVLKLLKEKYPDFPVLEETFREILEDHMDVENAERVLKWIETGESEVEFLKSTTVPSPFAHSIILAGAEDIVLLEDRDALLKELHRKILEKVVAKGTERKPEFDPETIENLIKLRQHLDPSNKGKIKEDILTVMENNEPLYIFRERKPSLFERMSVEREKVIKWCEELLKEGKIMSLRLANGESRWVTREDYPIYYNALYRNYKVDKIGEKILKILEKGRLATDELMKKLKISFGELRYSLKILEQNMSICKVGFKEKKGETIVIWDLVNKVLDEKELHKYDKHEALEILIEKLAKSNLVITPVDVSNITGLPEEALEDKMREMERKGILVSGYFYGLKSTPQFMLTKDYELLKTIKEENGAFPYEAIIRYLMEKQRLSSDKKLKCTERNLLKLLEEIGPLKNILSIAIRMKDFSIKTLIEVMKKGKILYAKGFRGDRYFMTREQHYLFSQVRGEKFKLDKTSKKILDLLKEKGPLDRNKISKEINMDKKELKKYLEKLENVGLIARMVEDPVKKTKQKFIYVGESRDIEDPHKELIKNIIYWYSPIPMIGLRWLTKFPRHLIELKLRELEEKNEIKRILIKHKGIEEFFITVKEYGKIKKSLQHVVTRKKTKHLITILPPDDPYALRGITYEARRTYEGTSLHPIIVNGELMGVIELQMSNKKLEIGNVKTFKKDSKIKKLILNQIKELKNQLNLDSSTI